jgi:hypothetical protein
LPGGTHEDVRAPGQVHLSGWGCERKNWGWLDNTWSLSLSIYHSVHLTSIIYIYVKSVSLWFMANKLQ